MSVLRTVAAVSAVWALSLPFAPQTFAQEPGGAAIPLAEVSGGYVYMRDLSEDIPGHDGVSFPKSWYFSGGVNPTEYFGLVGEISGSHKNNLDFTIEGYNITNRVQIYTFLAGPRFFHRFGRVVPYAQVLTGVAHGRVKTTMPAEFGLNALKTSSTNVAVQPGGGITLLLTNNVGLRAAADYRSIVDFVTDAKNDYNNQFRVAGGFVMQWGGR